MWENHGTTLFSSLRSSSFLVLTSGPRRPPRLRSRPPRFRFLPPLARRRGGRSLPRLRVRKSPPARLRVRVRDADLRRRFRLPLRLLRLCRLLWAWKQCETKSWHPYNKGQKKRMHLVVSILRDRGIQLLEQVRFDTWTIQKIRGIAWRSTSYYHTFNAFTCIPLL